MIPKRYLAGAVAAALVFFIASGIEAFTPLPIDQDPLLRMPGTQPDQSVNLQDPAICLTCHGERPTNAEGYIVSPGHTWGGSMMSQAARDPIFWACMAVAAQDSIWAIGNPNAVDICERCHFPEGWLAGRSDPPNASLMTGSDFDGVHCDFCHRMYDPFFAPAFAGAREGADWAGYWDESGNSGPGSGTISQILAQITLGVDAALAQAIVMFSGFDFFVGDNPRYSTYQENGSGQYFVSTVNAFNEEKRASFADTEPDHTVLYSRYHKSKYFCSTCHDVSNPVLANACDTLNQLPGIDLDCLADQSGGADLITEQYSAAKYFHVERTFSEFIISAYGRQGGAATNIEYQAKHDPPVQWAASCQDCHMRDVRGKGCEETDAPVRPDQSSEHPNSGAPLHDLQGGNIWVPYILGTLDDHFPDTFDRINRDLLAQGPQVLTLNLLAGISPMENGAALFDAAERAKDQLRLAGTIKNASYNPATGALSFRIQNNTGHKLITGFPEGRRMFVNIKAYSGASLINEINPYSDSAGTLKGLSSPSSPPLGPNETYSDELVYEIKPTSALTGEDKTFHFVLATGRFKDNRIPPKGFDIAMAAERLIEPAAGGVIRPDLFTAAEYAGGYDDVALTIATGADRIEINLYYQSTSREYIEFLRDEINGTTDTLSRPTPLKPGGDPGAYVVQTDPFFDGLKAWGDTLWDLWFHNHGLDGSAASVPSIVPFEMTSAMWPTVTDLTQLSLMSPAPQSSLLSPPTFFWVGTGGANNVFAVDLAYVHTGPYWSTFENMGILARGNNWTLPTPLWDMIAPGTWVYWKMRGADLAQPPVAIVESDEIYWFYRQ